jgi:hypothetical protein
MSNVAQAPRGARNLIGDMGAAFVDGRPPLDEQETCGL